MDEIKTCEQFVLRELNDRIAEIAFLRSDLMTAIARAEAAESRVQDFEAKLAKLKECAEISRSYDGVTFYISINAWSYCDTEKYAFLKELLGLEEPADNAKEVQTNAEEK